MQEIQRLTVHRGDGGSGKVHNFAIPTPYYDRDFLDALYDFGLDSEQRGLNKDLEAQIPIDEGVC